MILRLNVIRTYFQEKTVLAIFAKYGFDPEISDFMLSDTTAVNPALAKKLVKEWIGCSCHLLALAIKDALPVLQSILRRHRNIVCLFNSSMLYF